VTGSPVKPHLLADALRAVICSLEHERSKLEQGNPARTDGLWRHLETCAKQIAALDREESDRMKPVLLTLLDELQRTMTAFDAEHRHIAEKLRSAHRNMAAGAAYQQAKSR